MISLRLPEQVMTLERMGSAHSSRLSFMRILLRRIQDERWQICRTCWNIDKEGVGYTIYEAKTPKRVYSLIAFSHNILPEERSDRVIATKWDATFVLFDGIPTHQDIERLSKNVPKQEAGRVSDKELCLSRANRSIRLFDYVINQLAHGKQPDKNILIETGYLMRTTAVYGSGKFGLKTYHSLLDREEFLAPFQAELLSVYLIRMFSIDIVEHFARVQSAQAQPLDIHLKEILGIGNSTGLGMAPFMMNHPILLHHWVFAKESALRDVRNIEKIQEIKIDELLHITRRAILSVNTWKTQSEYYIDKIKGLKADLHLLLTKLKERLDTQNVWNHLYLWSENNLSIEGQELLVSFLIEMYPQFVDHYTEKLHCYQDRFEFDCSIKLKNIFEQCQQLGEWAKIGNYQSQDQTFNFWYVSADKLEPRMGCRYDYDFVEQYELPISIGHKIAQFYERLKNFTFDDQTTIAEYLEKFPEDRFALQRLQMLSKYPYCEVRDNLLDKDVLPIRLLRFKLAFFGASKFDPRSDRWLRIVMYQQAPFPAQLNEFNCDNWFLPLEENA